VKTAVVLCSHGIDGSKPTGAIEVSIVDDLCRHPERIAPVVDDADRVVLGVCKGEYSLGAIQAEVRRGGINPLGLELIDLDTAGNGSFDVVVNARIARAEAFTGSSPANSKISFPQTVNRRELLRGPPLEYHAAPSIETDLCRAESGCRACVDVCPQQALSVDDRRIHHDRSICEPCGLCVTACPTGATVNPATTPSQLEAEIAALLDPSVGPTGTRGIVFTCSRGTGSPTKPGWQAVTVPCTGMVPPGWMLAPLLMGAGSVAATLCHDSGCGLGHDARTRTAVHFCRELLRSLDQSPDRVSTDPTDDLPEPLVEAVMTDPFGPHGSVEVMKALAVAFPGVGEIVVGHAGAPTGIVQLHADACTACTMCAQICPTGALTSAESRDRVTISFDAARCTACAQCTHACPELDRGAISLEVTADLDALSSGRTTLIETDTVLCESCGEPIGPSPMLERITSMLGPDQGAIRDMIMSRCIACRGGGFR
jgi:ferredoxin